MLGPRLATAAVLIAGLLVALFALDRIALAAVVGVLLAAAAFEWGVLCAVRAPLAYAVGVGAAYGVGLWSGHQAWLFGVAAVFWIVLVPVWLAVGVRSRQSALLALAGGVVLVPAGIAVANLPPMQVLLLLGLTWVADTAAYFAGRRWGRRKLAPTVSPGKTRAGAWGALGATVAYAIICGMLVAQLRENLAGAVWLPYLAGAAVLCAASIVGDLFESAAKRQAGVKDSGTLLPGHGGVLDRIDSATSTLPLGALLLGSLWK